MPEPEQDLIRKADAGAQLVYALYHAPVEWWTGAPKAVCLAHMRACDAYRIGKNALEEAPWERVDVTPCPPS